MTLTDSACVKVSMSYFYMTMIYVWYQGVFTGTHDTITTTTSHHKREAASATMHLNIPSTQCLILVFLIFLIYMQLCVLQDINLIIADHSNTNYIR